MSLKIKWAQRKEPVKSKKSTTHKLTRAHDHEREMKPKTDITRTAPPQGHNFTPVIKERRSQWDIPRRKEGEIKRAEEEELRVEREIFKGTTPWGREIFRKLHAGIKDELILNRSIKKAHAYAEETLRPFVEANNEELKDQLLLNFSICWKLDYAKIKNFTLPGMASMMILWMATAVAFKIKNEQKLGKIRTVRANRN